MGILGVALGGMLAVGLCAIASGWARRLHPSPMVRVAPYVRDVRPDLAGADPRTALTAWPAAVLDKVLGGRTSVERRLSRLGLQSRSVEGFRIQQLIWGAVGFGVATFVALALWSWGRGSVGALLAMCVFGGVAGALGCDQHLSFQVAQREKRMRAELPVVADLLALSVAAGESPVAGLDRVVRVTRGALSDELAAVLAEIRTGATVTSAFDALAARTGVAGVARFAEGLAVALERGTPVVDVLHAQAADVRESARRDLIEEGGRREVAMMLPVVFLLLPVTVIFAFFPGYVGLHLS